MTIKRSCRRYKWCKLALLHNLVFSVMTILLCSAVIAQDDSANDDINKYMFETKVPRKALVITASKYDNQPAIPSTSKDGIDIVNKLNNLGFKDHIITSVDDDHDTMWNKIIAFQKTIDPWDLVIVYLSGHGFQWKGINFFAPKDIPQELSETNKDLTMTVIELPNIIERISQMRAGAALIIMDACRENTLIVKPRDGKPKSIGDQGLLPTNKQQTGVIVAFAADSGQLSIGYNDPKSNSLYTKHLLRHIDEPGKETTEILKDVTADVVQESRQDQTPRLDIGAVSFYLTPTDKDLELDKEAWRAVLSSHALSRSLVENYLIRWPVSPYAAAARQWLEQHRESVPSSRTFALSQKSFLL